MKTVIKPETEMKDSGIEYLGKIPTTWGKCRLKNVCTSFNSNITTSIINKEHGNYKIFGASGLIGYIEFETMQDEYLGIVKDGAGVGRIGSYPSHSSLLGTLAYIIPNDGINMKWLKYVIENMNLGESIDKTTIPHIYFSTYGNNYIPFPSSDEQQSIADYLDETCSKIDEIIAEAKASIDEYKELKQSAIDNATMTGIYNSEMKDTDYIWFHEMPKHWNLALASLLFREDVRPVNENDVSLSLSQIDGLIPTDDISERSLKSATHNNWKHVIPNDLVLNRFKGHLGVFFASRYTGMVSFHYGVYHAIRDDVYAKYYEYLFHSTTYKNIFALKSNGITVGLQNLSNSNFYSVKILHPSLDEQKEIVEYLDERCKQIDSLITEKQSLIADLEAYKKSLIYEVVTGKRRGV